MSKFWICLTEGNGVGWHGAADPCPVPGMKQCHLVELPELYLDSRRLCSTFEILGEEYGLSLYGRWTYDVKNTHVLYGQYSKNVLNDLKDKIQAIMKSMGGIVSLSESTICDTPTFQSILKGWEEHLDFDLAASEGKGRGKRRL